MLPPSIPPQVLAAVFAESVTACAVVDEPIAGSSAATTASVARLSGRTDRGPFSLIRKRFQPLTSGRHAAGAGDPRHWAYWRREAQAYRSGLLPVGPGLRAPRCYGIVDDAVYLEDVQHRPEDPLRAAYRLGIWQAQATIPDVPWLAGHQLAQRIAVTDLHWTAADDPRLPAVWARRHELLDELASVPRVLSHGDFHIGQLSDDGDTTVVLDWGTVGSAPAGADAAHLALSTLTDVDDAYREAHPHSGGYHATLLLTGVSRLHWMVTNGVAVPDGYAEFVLRPR
jgi:hypothetical protein